MAAQGVDPRSDPQDAAQLWLDAQEAKHTLSERSKATVVCIHAGIRMRIDVTRQRFEDLTRDLLERTETTTTLVVKQAGLTWPQIDRVLLVGGSGRMPMIGQMLRNVTGKEPDCSLSPDEVVAHGAAIYAAMLAGDAATAQQTPCKLINVNSHSLGVVGTNSRTQQKVNAVLIPKNTPLAVPRRSDFLDGQPRSAQRAGGRRRGRKPAARGMHRAGRVHRARPAARTAAKHGRRSRVCLRRRWSHFRVCPNSQHPLLPTRRDSTQRRPRPERSRRMAGPIVRTRQTPRPSSTL